MARADLTFRNLDASVHKARNQYWRGIDGTAVEKGPDLINNEALQAVNAAGTGLVDLIKLDANDAVVFPNGSSATTTATITAFSTGGQTSATAMTSVLNRVSTVAATGDSVRLPAATVGKIITVENRGAFPMQVFGASTDTINGIATATGISQGVKTSARYICAVAGNWEVPLAELFTTSPVAFASDGAIPAHVSQTWELTKAGVLVATLAAPTTGTDDGLIIAVTSATANAHTLTATGLFQTGASAVNLATFAAFAGAGLVVRAYLAKWQVVSSVGITFS